MDFKNYFSQLSDMKKLMFHYNNFFDLGPFLTFHSNVMDQKMAGAKKVIKTKNQFFHACQLRKGIFEIHSHWCCILRTCFQIFYWLPLFQELKFSAKNQLVQCFSTCRIRISWLLLHLRVTGLHQFTIASGQFLVTYLILLSNSVFFVTRKKQRKFQKTLPKDKGYVFWKMKFTKQT